MNKLNECVSGDHLIIKYLDGPEEYRRHLRNLGFVPTIVINVLTIINNDMIVEVFDSKIAINCEMCDYIYGTILEKKIGKKKILSRFKR